MKKHRRSGRVLGIFFLLLLLGLVVVGLDKIGIYRFDFIRRLGLKAELNIKDLAIPEDALSFSVYDMGKETYLYYEGDEQEPTVASLAKLFVIDYALTKVELEDPVDVNEEVLALVPEGSSLAHLTAGRYTVEQIFQAMLIPSGNDAAYALAYHLGKKDLGPGYGAEDYIDHFMKALNEYLASEGYTRTHLYDPSGFSLEANTQLEDINRVTRKLLKYPFIRESIGQAYFSIETPQGQLSWKNTNKFLDPESPYYNDHVKGVKTGTMASSYNIIVLYEVKGQAYLITCLAAHSDEGRYRAVQAAIDTIVK